MTTRTPCAVPWCGRTVPAPTHAVDSRGICSDHWRLRSPELLAAWRRIRALRRRSPGPASDHPAGSAAALVRQALAREERALWERTRDYVAEASQG